MKSYPLRSCLLIAFWVVASCAPKQETIKSFRIEPVGFSALPGWRNDNQAAALPALRASCRKLAKRQADAAVGTDLIELSGGDWRGPCQALPADSTSAVAVRAYFQEWFRPYKVSGAGGSEGLFTGYFEAELTGSRRRQNASQVPLYKVPRDHVTVDLGQFDGKLKGKRIIGRVAGRKLVPYYKRGRIDDGALKGQGSELIWADDSIDLFLMHIQGSGRVSLRDGSVMRVGFAGHNGHGYRSIGRVLIQRGELKRGQASWSHIRQWVESHPRQASALLAENPRYIFFRETHGKGPIGAQGVELTPGRSLAVDRRYIPFGAPVWLSTQWPTDPSRPLERLVIAQDTGAAIKGPVRGDFFWGHGKEALRFAGNMKSRGVYFLLLPKSAY